MPGPTSAVLALPSRFPPSLAILGGVLLLATTTTVRAERLSLAALAEARMSETEAETEAQPIPLAAEVGTGQLFPESSPHIVVTRTDSPPIIDGLLDDAAWADAPVFDDLRQIEPFEGGPPSERTEVRLLIDDDFLYIAIRAYDREPDAIRATQMRRDAGLGSDDRVRVVIDPFFDRRNGFLFEMNALGSRTDALVENNDGVRTDWDGIWFGRATRDADGWTAEMAIPFQTLSFDPDASAWGFNVERFIRRRNEQVRWAGPSRDIPFQSMADAGVAEGFIDIPVSAGVDVKPFFVGGYSRDHDTQNDDLDLDAGLDVFWKLRPELTLALTFNTDFAETEVDSRQVNLTRFPLFFPEKRDFFLQDAGIFEFGGVRRNPLPFFSRRIGLGAGGQVRDILVGAKLTGRLDDTNLGLLNVVMQEDEDLGTKNHTVARISRNVLEQSSIGAMATYGDPNARGDSWLGGLDFNYRSTHLDGGQVLEGSAWIQYADDVERGTDTAYGMKLGMPNDIVDWQLGYTEIGEDFDSALGFVPRRGIREWFGNYRYRWRPDDTSWWRRLETRFSAFAITDLENAAQSVDLDWRIFSLVTEEGDFFAASVKRERERLQRDFEIMDGVVIAEGDYWWNRAELDIGTTTKRPVNVNAELRFGDFYDGTRTDYELGFAWRASPNLSLSANLELNDIDLPGGSFITRIVRGRADVFFTPDLSWSTLVQFDNVSSLVGINSRVRWIVRPGSEMFFVVNQSIERETSGGNTSFRVLDTELTTKVGWTFRF